MNKVSERLMRKCIRDPDSPCWNCIDDASAIERLVKAAEEVLTRTGEGNGLYSEVWDYKLKALKAALKPFQEQEKIYD